MEALAMGYNSQVASGDLASESIIGSDSWYQTTVYTSLFTNKRHPDTGEQGYWGDAFEGGSYGSLLYTLAREKLIASTLRKAEDFAEQALAWLVQAGHAVSVSVSAEPESPIRMKLNVVLGLPNGDLYHQTEGYDLAAERS